MGCKGRKCRGSPEAVSKQKFPLGTLAARQRELREEFIGHSAIYKAERKRLKCLKEKVVMIIQLSQLRYIMFYTV